MTRHTVSITLLVCTLVACGGSNKNNSAWSTAKPNDGSTSTVATSSPAPTPSVNKGIGPVDHVDMASLDDANEPVGAKLFQEKCSACHKLDERYIGPALVGVTERRQPEWILNMILNPEVMVQQDPIAKALLAEFIAPMANQHLTREEAECILVYFREHDEEASDDDDSDEDEDETEIEEAAAVGRDAGSH